MSKLGKKLIQSVRELAAESHDHVDSGANGNGCLYVRYRQPSCIIGHALWRNGMIDESLECAPKLPDSHFTPNNQRAEKLFTHLNIKVGKKQMDWLQQVQDNQDGGLPWGDAVSETDRLMGAK